MSKITQTAVDAVNLYEFLKNHKKTKGVIVDDEKSALFASQALLLLGLDFVVLPDFRASFGDDLRSFQSELIDLSKSLNYYYKKNKKPFLIAPIQTICKFLPDEKLYESKTLEFGETIDQHKMASELINWGYTAVDIVEQKGEFSTRADILDIFLPSSDQPVRILLDLDQIESIRYFDESTQKTIKDELDSIEITPALFALDSSLAKEMQDLIDTSELDSFFKDINSLGFWQLNELGFGVNLLDQGEFCTLLSDQSIVDDIYFENRFLIDRSFVDSAISVPQAKNHKAIDASKPKALIEFHSDKKIQIVLNNESQLRQNELAVDGKFELNYNGSTLSLIAPNQLIISLNRPQKHKKRKKVPNILIDELSVGDLVVHENYGVGKFVGLEQVKLLGGIKDFVAILYQGEDKLLLPVENLYMIDRFVGDSSSLPILDKLGKGSFIKLKDGVKKKLVEIAGEIIERAALREKITAHILESPEVESFQNSAGFDYTPDQARAVEAILSDLASGKPMDRLLSADVGFGKTEVAMNAIFVAVKSGFQAAIVVPTTLLANQHYLTIKERFDQFGISVARLDRFTSTNEKRELTKRLKDGTLSVVVGTHAILKTEFDSLTLMVVDEEHKFGVKQKEALKDKAKNLHLLSMSATPIPRSLNMALSQIKTFSEILTPPENREDIRTFVKNSDDLVIKEAILRELRRGGQLFFVYNSIAQIEARKKSLLEILPTLRILVLHSQVASSVTEEELIAFQNGKYDILLSTTIIESGIHMPSVNTIIVDHADRFGIADLHQLRGRVGRGAKQGYCYFLVDDKDTLTIEAKKRLVALENNSYLGSGFALAFHDLEIRGGGNLLGADQSGHIKHIGYSLYIKMLEDALSEIKGEIKEEKTPVDLRLSIKAFISEEFIQEERIRLELYRRFAKCETVKEVYELEEELVDRFGKLDHFTRSFVDLMAIKVLATLHGVQVVQSYEMSVTITHKDSTKKMLNSPSKDDDDIIKTALDYLRGL